MEWQRVMVGTRKGEVARAVARDGPRILYLYTEVMGYSLATIRELVALGAEMHVVHWDHRRLSEFQIPRCEGVRFYPRTSLTASELVRFAERLAPDITVVSGWQDRDYLDVCKRLRRAGRTVVCGLDDKWFGTGRQRVGSALASVGYIARFFSHAWVSGVQQFEYARRFGFPTTRIVYDLYSADIALFGESYRRVRLAKAERYPHRFLFAGRLEPIKGVLSLAKSWKALGRARGDWELVVVGAGSLRSEFEETPGVRLAGFLQPLELASEMEVAGCAVVPSLGEPWGVVVHEFAASGLPIIASTAVGAAATFVIPGFNGYLSEAGDVESLAACMREIASLSDAQLSEVADRSFGLAQRITPCTSASNLLSVLGLGPSAGVGVRSA